ncbi:MAG: 4'-phosphopantetheinyl transferase superfamily protein [Motiliproteus sp.]
MPWKTLWQTRVGMNLNSDPSTGPDANCYPDSLDSCSLNTCSLNKKDRWHSPIALDHTIAIISIDLESADERLIPFQCILSLEERGRAETIRDAQQRRHWIKARAMLRMLLAQQCGHCAEELRFCLNDWGKPSIAIPCTPSSYIHSPYPHFNFSHSGKTAVLAMTSMGPLGVDVERIKASTDIDIVARRYFSSTEQQAFNSLPQSQRLRGFYQIWTRKEAYLKAVGVGLSGDLASFDVSQADTGCNLLLAVNGSSQTARHWTLADIEFDNGYVGAVAICARDVRISRYNIK